MIKILNLVAVGHPPPNPPNYLNHIKINIFLKLEKKLRASNPFWKIYWVVSLENGISLLPPAACSTIIKAAHDK